MQDWEAMAKSFEEAEEHVRQQKVVLEYSYQEIECCHTCEHSSYAWYNECLYCRKMLRERDPDVEPVDILGKCREYTRGKRK